METVSKKSNGEPNELQAWTERFYALSNPQEIFKPVQNSKHFKTERSVEVVGNMWHQFSEFMPWFLCQAAANVSSNAARTSIARIAWEELGAGHANEIHADQFLDCLKIANGSFDKNISYSAQTEKLSSAIMNAAGKDAFIFGMCLGLEIVAIENIETIFGALAVSEDISKRLNETPFFKIHRINEEGHIRHSVNNFLRFCVTEKQKSEFMSGFEVAVDFWKGFWAQAANKLNLETARA